VTDSGRRALRRAGPAVSGAAPAELATERRRSWRLDWFDAATLVLFLFVGCWTIIWLAARSAPDHLWTETNGPYLGDQAQYLGWIRQSSEHLLVDDPYQVRSAPFDYLHPGLAVSGALVRLGVSASLAYLMWLPVAALALFCSIRAYVRHALAGLAARRVALVLALFFLSPFAVVAATWSWTQSIFYQSFALEMWPAFYLWGYFFTALSVAAMIAGLLAYERDRLEGRVRVGTLLYALFCGWLQPWQGATFVLILMAAEVWTAARAHRLERPVVPVLVVATAVVPLLYYFALSRFDQSWALSKGVNMTSVPLGALFLNLAPIGIFALLGFRGPIAGLGDAVLRSWPISALVVLLAIDLAHVGTFPIHALQGLSVPFAVLAVKGARRVSLGAARSRTVLGAVVVIALSGWGVEHQLAASRHIGEPTLVGGSQPFYVKTGEERALEYLAADPAKGAVLSTVYLGEIVPAETGRRTWVGIASWTPNFGRRVLLADQLFRGELRPPEARALVRSTGARFLLASCQSTINLKPLLGSLVTPARRFSCAGVYSVVGQTGPAVEG